MNADQLQERYFQLLTVEALLAPTDRLALEQLLRLMHQIPFYWLPQHWKDENRAGDALSFRQYDFLAQLNLAEVKDIDQTWLRAWASASPSVLEVLVGIACRWAYSFEKAPSYFFGVMLINMNLHHYSGNLDETNRDYIRMILDNWMSRSHHPRGAFTPFALGPSLDVLDMRALDIWDQMNAYSAEYFQ